MLISLWPLYFLLPNQASCPIFFFLPYIRLHVKAGGKPDGADAATLSSILHILPYMTADASVSPLVAKALLPLQAQSAPILLRCLALKLTVQSWLSTGELSHPPFHQLFIFMTVNSITTSSIPATTLTNIHHPMPHQLLSAYLYFFNCRKRVATCRSIYQWICSPK